MPYTIRIWRGACSIRVSARLWSGSVNSAISRLGDLKALGVRLALDDFGTGYSSLACVHRFPLDVLKIDRSFVSSMGSDSDVAEIVRVIVDLANHLGLHVVAEGIDRLEQLTHVQALGCGYAQGYLFSVPVDSEAAQSQLSGNWMMRLAGSEARVKILT